MGFNKRVISEKSIINIANQDDYKEFFNYFKSDANLLEDKFSTRVLRQIEKCTIDDKDKIIKIMNNCKL